MLLDQNMTSKAWNEGPDEYLDLLVKTYMSLSSGEIDASLMAKLNADQMTLVCFSILHEELMDGGFCQLIYNGYGPLIFENPFAKALRGYGLRELSKVIYDAHTIYHQNKKELTRERSDEEFMAMYEQFEAFDDLEDWFIEEEEGIVRSLATYVHEHESDFII